MMLHKIKGKITILVAKTSNNAIGKNGELLFRIKEDLQRFRKITTNQIVVMGRKTYESIGRSLPNRTNIILTKNTKWRNYKDDNLNVYHSVEEVLDRYYTRNLYIIGGEEIYKKFLPYTDSIEMTLIDKESEGDSFFPELDNSWVEIQKETKIQEDIKYHFITLIRQ